MAIILPLILYSFIATGCYQVSGSFSEIKNEILSSTGSHYNRDIEFSLGLVTMSIVRTFVTHDDEDMLKNISGIQIGVYKGITIEQSKYNLYQKINEKLVLNGWKYFVRETDPNEMTLIYFQQNSDEKLTSMFIVSLNKNELSLIELNGELDKVIIAAIKKKGALIKQSDI
ncbi:MAG: DUF4252 domain-containing protein [Ignavibacteriaceae bacterium]